MSANLLTYATPKTLRDFGFKVNDREERGLGKRGMVHPSIREGYGKDSFQPPKTRPGKTHPGGRTMRRVLARLSARDADFSTSKAQETLTRPGSRKP